MLFIVEVLASVKARHLKISRWALSPRGLFCLVLQNERAPDKTEYTRDTIKYTMDINPQTKCSGAPGGVRAAQRSLCLFKNPWAGYFPVVLPFFFFREFLLCFYISSAGRKERDGEK